MKTPTAVKALLDYVQANKPDMHAQIKRWFDSPNAQNNSLAELALIGFEAGRTFERELHDIREDS